MKLYSLYEREVYIIINHDEESTAKQAKTKGNLKLGRRAGAGR